MWKMAEPASIPWNYNRLAHQSQAQANWPHMESSFLALAAYASTWWMPKSERRTSVVAQSGKVALQWVLASAQVRKWVGTTWLWPKTAWQTCWANRMSRAVHLCRIHSSLWLARRPASSSKTRVISKHKRMTRQSLTRMVQRAHRSLKRNQSAHTRWRRQPTPKLTRNPSPLGWSSRS